MKNRRSLHGLTLLYKINNNLSPKYLKSSFNTVASIHQYSTRQRNHLFVPIRRTTMSCRSFMHCMPVLYNTLPDDVRLSLSLTIFKSKCRLYLLHNQVG